MINQKKKHLILGQRVVLAANTVQNREWPQEVCYFIHNGVRVNSPNKERTASFMETGAAESQRTQPGKGPKRIELP